MSDTTLSSTYLKAAIVCFFICFSINVGIWDNFDGFYGRWLWWLYLESGLLFSLAFVPILKLLGWARMRGLLEQREMVRSNLKGRISGLVAAAVAALWVARTLS